jgi:hypothetical protein
MSTLYSDEHPEKSLKNTGYKNKLSAINTLKLIKKRSQHYQFTVINTMYYRAKNHQNKTKDMEEAMKIFKMWLDTYPEKKNKEEKLTLETINKIIKKLDDETKKIIKKYSKQLWRLKFIIHPKNKKYDYYSYLLYILKKS